jgi:hypothetical protein
MEHQADHGHAQAGEGHVAHDGRELLQSDGEVVRPAEDMLAFSSGTSHQTEILKNKFSTVIF